MLNICSLAGVILRGKPGNGVILHGKPGFYMESLIYTWVICVRVVIERKIFGNSWLR